ncbi:Protein transport protein sec20 [Savitreella phatthalungensis]
MESLLEIQRDLRSTGVKIARLGREQGYSGGGVEGRDSLAGEIREDLHDLAVSLDNFDIYGGELQADTRIDDIVRLHTRTADELAGLRRSFRRACGRARLATSQQPPLQRQTTTSEKAGVDRASQTSPEPAQKIQKRADWKTERSRLFGNAGERSPRKDKQSGKGAAGGLAATSGLLSKSSAVTRELASAHAQLSAELSRSLLSGDLLAQSSRDIAGLDQVHSGLGLILAGSRRLVRELEKANHRDRLHIYLALGLFGAVVAWIIYRRIIRRGLKPIIWLVGLLFRGSGKMSALVKRKVSTDGSHAGAAGVTGAIEDLVVDVLTTESGEADPMEAVVASVITTAVVTTLAAAQAIVTGAADIDQMQGLQLAIDDDDDEASDHAGEPQVTLEALVGATHDNMAHDEL